QRISSRVDRRAIERRIAMQAVEAVAGEHRAEGSRDGDAPLGVEPQREIRHEAVHVPYSTPTGRLPATPRRPAIPGLPRRRTPRRNGRKSSVDICGISWDIMGVNGANSPGSRPRRTDALHAARLTPFKLKDFFLSARFLRWRRDCQEP